MLANVSAYLKRLPPVPVTLDLVRQIDAHLAEPQLLAVKRVARENEREEQLRRLSRSARTYSSSGLPMLQVSVEGESLHLKLHSEYVEYGRASGTLHQQAEDLLQLLERGLQLPLTPDLAIGRPSR
jgi:hypothetical protein